MSAATTEPIHLLHLSPDSDESAAVAPLIAGLTDEAGLRVNLFDSLQNLLEHLTNSGTDRRPEVVLLPEDPPATPHPGTLASLRMCFGQVPVVVLGTGESVAGVAKAFREGADDYWWPGAKLNPATAAARLRGIIGKERASADRHSRLIRELEKAHRRARALSRQLVHLREAERTRMAREIHDELGQSLSGLKMDVAWLQRRLAEFGGDKAALNSISERLKLMSEAIDGTVVITRRICTELRPGVLDDLGLVAAVEWQAQEFEKRSNLEVGLDLPDQPVPLPEAPATAAFRIFQEVLTNTARHAQASRVQVRLTTDPRELRMVVEDDGKGFDEARCQESQTLGLLGMRERAAAVGGRLQIHSRPGQGTRVELQLPLKTASGTTTTEAGA